MSYPVKPKTVEAVRADQDSGIGVAAVSDGVYIALWLDGRETWSDLLSPDDADDIARMLTEEAAKARTNAAGKRS